MENVQLVTPQRLPAPQAMAPTRMAEAFSPRLRGPASRCLSNRHCSRLEVAILFTSPHKLSRVRLAVVKA